MIFEAFAERHGVEIGKFMMEHFIKERKNPKYIPEFSLVAVLANETIVGEVALHETDIITAEGKITQLVLSQRAVLTEYRMQGIMRKLVEQVLVKAEKWGDEGYMVCILKEGSLEGVTGTTYYYGG